MARRYFGYTRWGNLGYGVQQASPISSTPVDQWKDTKNLMSLGLIRPTENFFEAKKDKYFFFPRRAARVNLFRFLTFESTPNRHSIKIWIKSTMWLGVTSLFLKCFFVGDTVSWRGSSLQLVRFSLAFSLDSFSRSCLNSYSRSLLRLSSLGIDSKFRYSLEM